MFQASLFQMDNIGITHGSWASRPICKEEKKSLFQDVEVVEDLKQGS